MAPDRWLALFVRLPQARAPHPLSDPIPELLLELGGRGVEEKEGGFLTFLLPPDDPDALVEEARRVLERATGYQGVELTWHWQPQEDWEILWRQGLGVRRITPRLLVAPSWEAVEPGPGEILITLDPGMAFGTAEHATTRGSLRLLDGTVEPGQRICDVGSGSGILSIAAALLGAEEVLGLEMDDLSCEAARENLDRNGVADRVRVEETLVEGSGPLPGAPYHGVVANLQRHLTLPLLDSFRASLLPGGWLVLSGMLLEERDEMVEAAGARGFVLDREEPEGEWWSGGFRLNPPSS